MYRHCVYCAADLGANREVEEFPVGRRLAFDPGKGRLWAVCRRCERWNLSPLEERWEALEALERRYRGTRARVSTENIGLARLDEGLELVRVGRPRRPEFAAWRYGDQFGRRRRRFVAHAVIGGGVIVGLGVGSGLITGLSALALPAHLYNLGRLAHRKMTPHTRIHASDGRVFALDPMDVGAQKLRPSGDHETGWCLEMTRPTNAGGNRGGRSRGGRTRGGRVAAVNGGVDADVGDPILTGADAVHALSILLPKINTAGGGKRQVQSAVGLIEEAGSPEAYFRQVEHHARRRGYGYNPLRRLPMELRLGLEMAAHEDQERAALEGELALLEEAWKEAEALAAIADDLLLPDSIRGRLRRLRGATGRNAISHEVDEGD